MYKYKFPIGDWSGDGHQHCDWFIVSGTKPVEHLREVHFKCDEVFGFDPGDMCKDYNEMSLDEDIIDKIKKTLGESFLDDYDLECLSSNDVFKIWLSMLNHVDPELDLKETENDIPMINFYGYDKKKRHLETPGYGLFE